MAFKIDRSRSIISAMIYGRRVTAMDVAWLRREVFAQGAASREAIEELFEVERSQIPKVSDWTDFFVEMVTEHIMRGSRPLGELDEGQAEWLLDQADSCKTSNSFAALVNVLGEARSAPRWFVAAVRGRAVHNWAGLIALAPPGLVG